MNINMSTKSMTMKRALASTAAVPCLALLMHTTGRADILNTLNEIEPIANAKISSAQTAGSLEGKLQPIADRLDRLSTTYLEFEETSPKLARVALASALILAKTTAGAAIVATASGAVGAVVGGGAGAAEGAALGAITGATAGAVVGVAGEAIGEAVHRVAEGEIAAMVNREINELSPLLMKLDHTLTPESAVKLGGYWATAKLSSRQFSDFIKSTKETTSPTQDSLLEKIMHETQHDESLSGIRSASERDFAHMSINPILNTGNAFRVDSATATPTTSPDGYFYDPSLYRDLWNKDPKDRQDAIDRPFYSQLKESFRDSINSGTLPPENPYESYRSLWNTELHSAKEMGSHESQESPFFSPLKDSFREYVNDGTLPREGFLEAYRPLWNNKFDNKQTLTSSPFYPATDGASRDTSREASSQDSGYYNPLTDPLFWQLNQE